MNWVDTATRSWRRRLDTAASVLVCVLALGLIAGSAVAGADVQPAPAKVRAAGRSRATAPTTGTTGTLIGHVTAPVTDDQAIRPAAGVIVTATDPSSGATQDAYTDANGFYEIDGLAPDTYDVSFALVENQPRSTQTVTVPAGATTALDGELSEPLATVTGTVTDHHHRLLPGMAVGLGPTGPVPCPAASVCGTGAMTGADGEYSLTLAPGTYELRVLDGNQLVDAQAVTAAAGQTATADVHLTPASVPAGSSPRHVGRDLRRLNAERAAAGLPAGIVINPRWSQECAAHDVYERANEVLSATENPQAPGASAGGAWAGLVSVLAQGHWTPTHDPWEHAPIHLMQLLTPSLSVVGLDDSAGRQCATTYPGLLRTPVTKDAVTTYPAGGANGVPPREIAREAPFVPGQFVGIPAGRATGRELFVYLNQSGRTGQAQVRVVRATLAQGHHRLAVRSVDNTTRTIGHYLTGAILIPVKPLRGHTTYRATVVVSDRAGTLSHSWSFTTGHS